MIAPAGARIAARSGIAAATLNVVPEASAACNGLAAWTSDRPSSSRTCAPRASCAVSSSATLRAVASLRPRSR